LCFVDVLFVSFEFVNHGSRRGNMAQALDQWRHPVGSSEALDVLHQVMCPASYHCIAMAIEMASDSPAFVVVINSLSPTTIAK
jgi:hypothetical protein